MCGGQGSGWPVRSRSKGANRFRVCVSRVKRNSLRSEVLSAWFGLMLLLMNVLSLAERVEGTGAPSLCACWTC